MLILWLYARYLVQFKGCRSLFYDRTFIVFSFRVVMAKAKSVLV